MSTARRVRVSPRRIVSFLLAAALAALALPSVALAAPPVETVETTWGTRPGAITTEDGTLDFHVFYSDRPWMVGSFTWTGPDGAMHGVERFATVEGNRLTGDMWAYDAETHEFVGLLTFVFDFTFGEPATAVEALSEGNRRTILAATRYPATVTGSITLPNGVVFPVVNKPGSHQIYETWSNAPASTVLDGQHTFVRARWILGGTEIVLVGSETAIARQTSVTISRPDGELVGDARLGFVDDRLVGEIDLLRSDLSVGGTASVDMTLRSVGSSWEFEDLGYQRTRTITEEIVASGGLSLTLDGQSLQLSLEDAEVEAFRTSWHGIRYPTKGDEPEG